MCCGNHSDEVLAESLLVAAAEVAALRAPVQVGAAVPAQDLGPVLE